ncbi:MAG: hypothetical protein U0R66_02335 [Mycobacterium sp.]
MCRAANCKVCGKTTWAGCGMHVDAVKRTVPAGQWCDGHSGAEMAAAPKRSWFRRKG